MDILSKTGFEGNGNVSPHSQIEKEYGPSNFNRRRLTASFNYLLPFKGEGAVGGIAGGWRTNGVDISLTGIGQDRFDIIGDPTLPGDRSKADFTIQAYAEPAAGTFGTRGRNTARGPGRATMDFSTLNHSNLGNPNTSIINVAHCPAWIALRFSNSPANKQQA